MRLLEVVSGIAITLLGLSVAGWGVWHFNDPPIPTRHLGYIQYETSAQLKAISGGLIALTFGTLVIWYAFLPRAKGNRQGMKEKGR